MARIKPRRRSIAMRQKRQLTESDVASAKILGPISFSQESEKKLYYGKIYLKKGKGRALDAVFKPIFGHFTGRDLVKKAGLLRKLGLPVPHMGVVEIDSRQYLAIEPFLEKGKVSKIEPVNDEHGNPVFLKKLTIENPNHRELIEGIATDLATIYNAGYGTKYLDAWGFIKLANGNLKRIIFDFDSILKEQETPEWKTMRVQMNLDSAKKFFGENEFELLKNTLQRHLRFGI